MLKAEFADAMRGLGPFGVGQKFAVGVSGGADSTALALLMQSWAASRGASSVALIVDHGLRAAAAAEAALTRQRLLARGIEALVLRLDGLPAGAKLQETARAARHAILAGAARDAGALFLLLGHHARDQSETVAMRAKRGTGRGTGGLEGMASWSARNDVVLLRPLLGLRPECFREFLTAEQMPWLEDPSNTDTRFERVRVRLSGVTPLATGAEGRRQSEMLAAEFLARHAVLRPEGFALLQADAAPAPAFAALLRLVGGAQFPPRQDAVAALAAKFCACTLGGVRIMPAGRLGSGWLLVREPSACAPPIPAIPGAIWDGRFKLLTGAPNAEFGAVGSDAAKFRKHSDLPAVVLRGLPCLRTPHPDADLHLAEVAFNPPQPATAHPFSA